MAAPLLLFFLKKGEKCVIQEHSRWLEYEKNIKLNKVNYLKPLSYNGIITWGL